MGSLEQQNSSREHPHFLFSSIETDVGSFLRPFSEVLGPAPPSGMSSPHSSFGVAVASQTYSDWLPGTAVAGRWPGGQQSLSHCLTHHPVCPKAAVDISIFSVLASVREGGNLPLPLYPLTTNRGDGLVLGSYLKAISYLEPYDMNIKGLSPSTISSLGPDGDVHLATLGRPIELLASPGSWSQTRPLSWLQILVMSTNSPLSSLVDVSSNY